MWNTGWKLARYDGASLFDTLNLAIDWTLDETLPLDNFARYAIVPFIPVSSIQVHRS